MSVTSTHGIEQTFSTIYKFIHILNKLDVGLLTVGDDEFDGSIQVRQNNIRTADNINHWLHRSVSKVARVSWIEISISGYDGDDDYRSIQFKMCDSIGSKFLNECNSAAENNSPIHQLLTVIQMK